VRAPPRRRAAPFPAAAAGEGRPPQLRALLVGLGARLSWRLDCGVGPREREWDRVSDRALGERGVKACGGRGDGAMEMEMEYADPRCQEIIRRRGGPLVWFEHACKEELTE
jgi:hypothetical protein